MNYTTEYTILLSLLYLFIIAIKYSPNCNNAAQSVKYFVDLDAPLEFKEMNLMQLRKVGKNAKIPNYSKMPKVKLLETLEFLQSVDNCPPLT